MKLFVAAVYSSDMLKVAAQSVALASKDLDGVVEVSPVRGNQDEPCTRGSHTAE